MKKNNEGSDAVNYCRALHVAAWDANSKKKEDKECLSKDKILND